MDDVPWYQEFFGEDYLRTYAPVLGPERAARQAEQIDALLALPPGSRVLDLACGHGRLTIPLAQRGYRMVGQDLSPVFLDRARADATAQGTEVEWVHRDMREIPFEGEFDAAINIFTAFGYLESEEEDQQVLRQVWKALKPGGAFLIETIHRDALLRRFQPCAITRFEDGLLVLEERHFDVLTSREEVRKTLLYPEGGRREYRVSLRLYTAAELARLLAGAGLRLVACYGGLEGSALTLESFRMAVLARKE